MILLILLLIVKTTVACTSSRSYLVDNVCTHCPANRFNLDNDDGNGCESSCNPDNGDECYEDSDGWKSAAGKTITNLVLTSIGGTYTASTDCDGNHAIWGNYSHGNVVQGKHVYENIAADLVVLDYGTYKRIQPAATAQETLPITSETSLYDVRTHFISDLIGRMNVFKQVATKRKMKLKAAIDTLDNHKPWTLRREIVKSSKIMMNRIDLPPVYDTIKSKMKANIAYVETEYVQGENTNCGDEEDGIPDCCSYDFSQDTDTSVIVGLDETVGAWSVLCNGSTIVSKQTRKSLTNALNGVATYDMECWSASTSKFEGALVKQTGNEFVCGSYKVLVGSQTIGDGDRTCDDIYGNGDNTAFASCVSGVNHLKDDLNIPCASSTCTVSDCCDANPTCDDIDGSGADFASSSCVAGTNHLKDVLTNTCANSTTCTANDCCDANPTCGNTDGTGTTFASCVAWSNHLKDDLTYTCADGTCDADDCCDDNPTCDDFNCTGYGPPLNYEDTYTCYGHTCTDTECCNAPTCDGSAITEANAARTGGSATGGTGAPSATEAVATTIIFTCDHSAGFGDAAATTRYTCSALGTFAEDSDVTCPAAAPTCDGSAITEANAAVTGGTGAVAATQPVGSTIIFTCSHIYGFGDAALTTKYTCGALGTFDEDSDVTCPTAAPTCDGSGVTHANAARTGGDANADNGAPSATEAGGTTIIFTCAHIYGFGDAALTTKYTCGALGTFDEDSDVTCPTAAPATCSSTSHSCSSGELKSGTITCSSSTCTDSECCDATCSSTSHSCSSGELKSGTITCSSSTCTDTECCDATCSSTSHSCSSGELKSNPESITCSSSTCTDNECCNAPPGNSGGNVVCIHPDVTVHVLVGVDTKAVTVGNLDVGDLVVGEGRTSTVRRVERFQVNDDACVVPSDLCGGGSDPVMVSQTHAVRCPSWPANTWTFCQPDWQRVATTEYVHVELESYITDHLLSGSVVLESWDGYARATDAISDACDKQGCPWPHKWVPSGDHRWTRVDLRQILFDSSPRLRIVRVSSNNPTSQVIIQ